MLGPDNITNIGPIRTGKKICLFRQNFCHHQRSTSVDGLSRLDNFWQKWTKLQMHRRQNLSQVKKIGQNRLNKQNLFILSLIYVIKLLTVYKFSVSVVSHVNWILQFSQWTK